MLKRTLEAFAADGSAKILWGMAAALAALVIVVPTLMAQDARAGHRRPESATLIAPLERLESFRAAPLNSCSSAPTLACGTTVSGSPGCPLSSNNYVDFWTFNATQGQTATFRATSSSSSQMLLTVQRTSDGSIVASSFAVGTVSVTYTFPTSDPYFIGFGYTDTFQTPPYQLTATCGGSSSGTCSYAGVIPIGSSISGQLTSTDTTCGDSSSYAKAYRLPVIAGDSFEVSYSANFPVYLELDGPATSEESGAWHSSKGASVTMGYVAPANGNVTVYAMSNTTSPTTGTFTISVTRLSDPCRRRAVKH
ncbi:MAG TPA: hypothetical protein VGR95_22680 [Thermoanaerobaculia bacterium]|nr:hypothetical protein [Thermoanaerobaculia bacterium]